MKETLKVNRNQFMKGLLGAGTMAFFPFFSTNNDKHSFSQKSPVDKIIKGIDGDMKNDGRRLKPMEINNLIYAFNLIKPANHQDLAFVIACCIQDESANHIADEYVRRKQNKKQHLPDHPISDIKVNGIPKTQGILIYWEQLDSLLAMLIGLSETSFGFRILSISLRGGDEFIDIRNQFDCILNRKSRKRYNRKELLDIYKVLSFYAPKARVYTWCSTMATRASLLI